MIPQQIKDDIEDFLGNAYEFDYNSIKSNLENVLNNHKNELNGFKVVCDDSNNSHRWNGDNFFNVDIYLQPIVSVQYLTLNIVIEPDKIIALRKLRKEKLRKIGII